MTAATEQMLAAWDSLGDGAVINVAAQLSALALDIVGRALFGADLTSDAAQLRRALAVGQKASVLATFAPVQWGPVSSRALKAVTRWAARSEGIEGPVQRVIAARRARPDGPRDLLDVLINGAGPGGAALPDPADAPAAPEWSTCRRRSMSC